MYSSTINTDAEPSCQSVKLNDQCEVIDEMSNISVSQKDVNHLMTTTGNTITKQYIVC